MPLLRSSLAAGLSPATKVNRPKFDTTHCCFSCESTDLKSRQLDIIVGCSGANYPAIWVSFFTEGFFFLPRESHFPAIDTTRSQRERERAERYLLPLIEGGVSVYTTFVCMYSEANDHQPTDQLSQLVGQPTVSCS